MSSESTVDPRVDDRECADARDFLKKLRMDHPLWRGQRSDKWAFRGQADAAWSLVPKAFRPSTDFAFTGQSVSPPLPVDQQRREELRALNHFLFLADRVGRLPLLVALLLDHAAKGLPDVRIRLALSELPGGVGEQHRDLRTADRKLDPGFRHGMAIGPIADLADDLRRWLTDKLARLQRDCLRDGRPVPAALPADTPVFKVPSSLLRVLNRDLEHAGIPKIDDRGRSVDLHALRHTFGTLLSKGGVPPRTAQAAMRHSTIDLTMNVYTGIRAVDLHGAVEASSAACVPACVWL